MDVCIIFPTKDEQQVIGRTIEEYSDYRCVIADDSTDNTRLIAKTYNVRVIEGVGNESGSIRKAIEEVDSEYIVIADSDGSHPASLVKFMIEELNSNDVVVGSRFVDGGGQDQGSLIRSIMSGFASKFARISLGLKVKDDFGRFIATRRKYLLDVPDIVWSNRYDCSSSFLYYANKMGLKIKEIPYFYTCRAAGKSKGSIRKFLKFVLGTALLRIEDNAPFTLKMIQRKLSGGFEISNLSSKQIILSKILYIATIILGLLPIGRGGYLRNAYYWRRRLAYLGKDVIIEDDVRIVSPENIWLIGNNHIDHCVELLASAGKIRIGKNVVLHSFSTVSGKDELEICDYACIGAGARIYPSTNTYRIDRPTSFSAIAEDDMQSVIHGKIRIGKYSFIGANSVLIGSNIGDNCVIGALSFVKKDVPDGAIAVGSPARIIKRLIFYSGYFAK